MHKLVTTQIAEWIWEEVVCSLAEADKFVLGLSGAAPCARWPRMRIDAVGVRLTCVEAYGVNSLYA